MREVEVDGYKYLLMDGRLIPILDENGDHVKADEVH